MIAHELTHVLHAQNNIAYSRISAEAHWLVEGLAVFASGQFVAEYAAQSAARLRDGFAPSTFAQLWNDPSAYALAGSLIRYVDVTMGRSTVQRLFGAESLDEVLRILGTSESALLTAWREYAFNGRVQASGAGV